MDTGASSHFVNDASLFIEYTPNSSTILLADNSETTSEGHGTILWKTVDKNNKQITIKLKNVRMVSNLKQNLFSLSALFQQYPSATEIARHNNNVIIRIKNKEIEFKLKNRLFQNQSFLTKVKVIKTTIQEKEFMQQHLKMGHLNCQDLAKLLRKENVKISNKIINDFTCESCSKMKSTIHRPKEKRPHSRRQHQSGFFHTLGYCGPRESLQWKRLYN